MRNAVLVGLMVAISCAASAKTPQKATSKPDYAKAYAMAARCMVFNTYVSDKTTARVAFDAWKRLGELRRLTNAEMSDDMDWAVSNETVQLSQNPDYRAQTRVNCRALGWAK
jgi:hypothetical protein